MTFRHRVEISRANPSGSRLFGDDAFGSGDYGGATQWSDIACDVIGADIDTGRRAPLSRPEVGRCSVTVTGWHPAVADPQPMFTGRPFRLSVEDPDNPGTWLTLFTGTVEDARMTLVQVPGRPPSAGWTITAHDALGALQRVNMPAGTETRPAEKAEQRVAACCQLAGLAFANDLRAPITIVRDVQASQLAQPLLQEAGIAADSAGLIVYANPAGDVVVTEESDRARHASNIPDPVYMLTADPPPADALIPGTDFRYIGGPVTAQLADGRGTIRNAITIGAVGGTARTSEDATSIGTYGRRDYSRTDLITSNGLDLTTLAADWLSRLSRAQLRVAALEIPFVGADGEPMFPIVRTAAELVPGATVYGVLPADESGRRWSFYGRTLGHTLRITAERYALTLYAALPVKELS